MNKLYLLLTIIVLISCSHTTNVITPDFSVEIEYGEFNDVWYDDGKWYIETHENAVDIHLTIKMSINGGNYEPHEFNGIFVDDQSENINTIIITDKNKTFAPFMYKIVYIIKE